jgi:hypothetical protein
MAKHPGGRPTKQTPEVEAKLEEWLVDCQTIEDACDYAGISIDSFRRWLTSDESFASKMARAQAAGIKRLQAEARQQGNAWRVLKSVSKGRDCEG